MISLSNPCCYMWLATNKHLAESRNGKQLPKYYFGDCQHDPISTNTWGCLAQEEGWWPTLTVQGGNMCRSWALLTAPGCSPLASHAHFGGSRCGTLKPQGSLGINFLCFLLRSELQLTEKEAKSSFELPHHHRCKFQLHQIHPQPSLTKKKRADFKFLWNYQPCTISR